MSLYQWMNLVLDLSFVWSVCRTYIKPMTDDDPKNNNLISMLYITTILKLELIYQQWEKIVFDFKIRI
jgi:hypothetical protein